MNQCCFKGSSMGLKVDTNIKMTHRFPRNWRIPTPQCPKYQGVVLLFVWKIFVVILICEVSQILENYVTYNL